MGVGAYKDQNLKADSRHVLVSARPSIAISVAGNTAASIRRTAIAIGRPRKLSQLSDDLFGGAACIEETGLVHNESGDN
jgi:hypothetical protein